MKNFKILIALILSSILMVGCSRVSDTISSSEMISAPLTESQPVPQEQEMDPSETKEQEEILEKMPDLLKDDEDYDIPDNLREALNKYEDFVDEYCEFMVTWMNANQNWQLANMEKYVKYTQAISDCQKAINEGLEKKDEITKDEYDYLVLVQTRTAQKLLTAASEGYNGD